ncbi:MAG: alanine--tRNA ligase, partial [Pseudomonadota bacterium]
VLQNVHNNYEIDLFQNLINFTSDIVKLKPEGNALISYRVLADHLRSSAFLIADGVMPSNEGRGYVLRRIMRRAMRHVHHLGYKEPLMHQLLSSLINEMGNAYPELIRAQGLISDVLLQEEIRFKQTLDKGLKHLDDELSHMKNSKLLKGEVAFKLYDTYGFPLDLTQDILKSKDLEVDMDGFDQCMLEQKTRARAAWVGSGEQATNEIWFELYQKNGATEFLGYNTNEAQAIVLAIIDDNDGQIIVTNQTPFYGESGGQMGDIGSIVTTENEVVKVLDTKKFLGKIHAHYIAKSSIKVGDTISLKIDEEHRNKLRANHSATHLLHLALREILGNHLAQKGSLVASDRLRFDFSHNKSLSQDEISKVEDMVNQMIRQNFETNTQIMSNEQAISSGAMALFGEKYDEEVRVVSMGKSTELCGGTHVQRTGDIAIFKIISESAIAAGIRRIEALTGKNALLYMNEQEQKLSELSVILKTPKAEISDKISNLIKENKSLEDELTHLKKKLLLSDPNIKTTEISGISLIENFAENIEVKDLRNFVEHLQQTKAKTVIVAGSKFADKTSLIIGVSKDLVEKIDASCLAREANELAGGQGGGGRVDLAQAGGYIFESRDEISKYLKQIIIAEL